MAAAIAVLGLASPAAAQSFNRPEGTGNELPSYYDNQGGLHAGIAPQQIQIAAHRSGMNTFASVREATEPSAVSSKKGGLRPAPSHSESGPAPDCLRSSYLEAHCKQHGGSACSKSNQVIAPIDSSRFGPMLLKEAALGAAP